jgi:hypothetical protein
MLHIGFVIVANGGWDGNPDALDVARVGTGAAARTSIDWRR